MNIFAEKKTVAPYAALAPIYDQVMAHVNYKRWAAYVHKIIRRHHVNGKWIIDISCGTGTCALYLEKHGYLVTGLDTSLAMLKCAAQKNNADQPNYICADLRYLPLAEAPDVFISLYDSMNYILDAEGWQKALKNIYDHLQENGLFIFDVSTVLNSQKDFSKYVHRETFKNGSYFRKSFYDRRNSIQINSFEIKLPTHPKVIFCERHQQRIRPLSEIVQFIAQSPFALLAGYKEFTFTPFDEECERVHFVLRKEPQKYVRTS